jgi:hypothetical protein
MKKTDQVREAVRSGEWKKALKIAKDFRIGVNEESRAAMTRAYECMLYPDFYRQIGTNIDKAIENGKAIVASL